MRPGGHLLEQVLSEIHHWQLELVHVILFIITEVKAPAAPAANCRGTA